MRQLLIVPCLCLAALGAAPPEIIPEIADRVQEVAGTLPGVVVDPDGRPVAGIEVHWRLSNAARDAADWATATTDEHGWFELPRRAMLLTPQNFRWSYVLVAHPDYAPLMHHLGQCPERLDLQLERGHTVPVQVNCRYRSTEGVKVRSNGVDLNTYPEWVSEMYSAETDAFGRCELTRMRTGMSRLGIQDDRFLAVSPFGEITVDRDGVVRQRIRTGRFGYVPVEGAVKIEVDLANELRGRVIYGLTGAPVAGISVRAGSRSGERRSGGSAVTDANGRYVIKGLAPVAHDVWLLLTDEQAAEWTAAAVNNVRVLRSQPRGVRDMVLLPGALILGQVVPAEGQDLPSVLEGIVYGPAQSDSHQGSFAIADDGSFELRVPPGWTRLFVYAGGVYGPGGNTLEEMYPGHPVELELAEGDIRELEFSLATPEPLPGIVLGPDGEPVPEARVLVSSVRHGDRVTWPIADAEGRFEIGGNHRGTRLEIRAWHGHAALPEPLLVGPDELKEIAIELVEDAAGVATGFLQWDDGRPHRGFVLLEWLWDGQWRDAAAEVPDRNGRYTVTCPQPAVLYRIHVNWQDPGIEILDWYSEPFYVAPGETIELPVLTLSYDNAEPRRRP